MKVDEISSAITASLDLNLLPGIGEFHLYRQALSEYEAPGPEKFNALVQDAAKKLKAKLLF